MLRSLPSLGVRTVGSFGMVWNGKQSPCDSSLSHGFTHPLTRRGRQTVSIHRTSHQLGWGPVSTLVPATPEPRPQGRTQTRSPLVRRQSQTACPVRSVSFATSNGKVPPAGSWTRRALLCGISSIEANQTEPNHRHFASTGENRCVRPPRVRIIFHS